MKPLNGEQKRALGRVDYLEGMRSMETLPDEQIIELATLKSKLGLSKGYRPASADED